MIPLPILLLTAFLTMGIAAAAERVDNQPVEITEEEAVGTSGPVLLTFLLAPISTAALTQEEDLGRGVDNRPDH